MNKILKIELSSVAMKLNIFQYLQSLIWKYFRISLKNHSTAADFFIDGKCKLTIRRNASNKPFTADMLKVRRGPLVNYLLDRFSDTKLDELDLIEYEEWRLNLPLANSTKEWNNCNKEINYYFLLLSHLSKDFWLSRE